MATYVQVLTDLGRNMVADADAGMTLTFTRVELGSGVINPALIPGMVALPPVSEMDATISGPPMRNQPFQVTIPATIVPANIPRGFFMNAIGVWGTINGVNPRLYSVGYPVLADGITVGTGDFVGMPTGASVTEHYLRIATAVNRAIDVECIFDPLAVEVYVANVDEDAGGMPIPPTDLGAGVWARRTGSGYLLKRLVMGPNIEIEEDADTITIGVRTLAQNLDLYVPTSHPLATPDNSFDTIPDALGYLSNISIPMGLTATINIDDTTNLPGHGLTHAASINITHPNGESIIIRGAPVITTNVTGQIGGWGGATGNYTIQLNVASSAGFTVGDAIIIRPTAGTGSFWVHGGAWLVTGVGAGVITYRNTYYQAGFRGGLGVLTGGTITKIPSILRFPSSHGFNVNAKSLGNLINLFLTGDQAAGTLAGIIASRGGFVGLGANIGIFGFRTAGVFCQNRGSIINGPLVVSGSVGAAGTGMGITATEGGYILSSSPILTGHQQQGALATNDGRIAIVGARVYGCGGSGLDSVWAQLQCSQSVIQECYQGVSAQSGGQIEATFSLSNFHQMSVVPVAGRGSDFEALNDSSININSANYTGGSAPWIWPVTTNVMSAKGELLFT